MCVLSCVQLFVTPWTVARQAPRSMGFSRQEYWSELPLPPPGDLPDAGTEPSSLASPALAGRFFQLSHPGSSDARRTGHKKEIDTIRWAKKFIQVFPQQLMEKPK